MKKILLFINILFIYSSIFSQEIIFEKKYTALPFEIKIENSGIYSIASFDIRNDEILLSSFNEAGIFSFKENSLISNSFNQTKGRDFSELGINKNLLSKKENSRYQNDEAIRFRKNYFNRSEVLEDENGIITNASGEKIIVAVPNRDRLIITSNIPEIKEKIEIDFPSNLACADLIGIDKSGKIFILAEKYLSDIPLEVERDVYVLSKSGELISRLKLPMIKYLFTLKDLNIDSDGNLYHMVSFPDKVQIIKWSNLTTPTKGIVEYPSRFNQNIHFNNYVTTDEVKTTLPKNIYEITTTASRTKALHIADTYVVHQYRCTSANLAPSDVTAPDGDVVRTPDWLVVGENARIPYKWGGFNTLSQFDYGLAGGKYAGDINTNGVSSYAVGVDCSGYVSRCWQLTYHASTAYMPNITTQYSSWDDLKPGDAVHKVGHVRLFVERNINGTLKIAESTGRGWGVSYYTYSISDLSNYTPRYYNKMESNYNAQRPILLSANLISENSVELKWSCDTTALSGYKVYSSSNGSSWGNIAEVLEKSTLSTTVSITNDVSFFRISSVKDDSPNFSESNWSNVLGVSNFNSSQKVLIVDGFDREDGSWRGPGHAFVTKYGKALSELSYKFTSIKTNELQNGNFSLSNYDFVFWILGDESTIDETFNSTEQALVESYLQDGGSLFVSGSEIGWDLDHRGSTKDKDFYNNYLKASYVSDDAGQPTSAMGVDNTSMKGCELNFGQTYEEDYPDEIAPVGGSIICMKFANGKNAGVQFTGKFENSNKNGNLIYLSFPLETTADDSDFNQVISGATEFFKSNPTSTNEEFEIVKEFRLEQNYPNPFNPTTTINYSIPSSVKGKTSNVKIIVYNSLGQKVAELINKSLSAGNYSVKFDAGRLSSGIYFYRLETQGFIATKKLILLR